MVKIILGEIKVGLKNGRVLLEENYLNWLKMFEGEKQNLEEIFGELAIKIEHIGSTAIKGIKAKPIVDIVVAVKDFDDIKMIKNKLECFYTIEEGKKDEILLIKEEKEITYFLIHVMKIDSKRYKDTIAFRDYIKNNYEIMKQYEELKIKLAKQYSDDRIMYTKFKNDFIQNILKNIDNNDNL